MQRLNELEPSHFDRSDGKSGQVTLIEITMFKGRSPEAEKNLYTAIVRNLAKAPGIDSKDIVIVLSEPPTENWSLRAGMLASESGVGSRIDV